MAEGDSQMDGNNQAAAASSSAAEQQQVVTPPAGEQPVTTGAAENRIPQSRFNEVVEQKNREREMRMQYEARIRELESRQSAPNQSRSVVDTQVERLVNKLGLTKDAAMELVQATDEISKAKSREVEQRLQQYEVNRWQENLSSKFKDYKGMEPKMAEVWNTLSPLEQQAAVSSQRGLEQLYHYAKSQDYDGALATAREDATAKAYETKLAKQAATSLPGASSAKPGGKLSVQAINDMSLDEFKKRKPEIDEFLANHRAS